jgi:hypothetical protein
MEKTANFFKKRKKVFFQFVYQKDRHKKMGLIERIL